MPPKRPPPWLPDKRVFLGPNYQRQSDVMSKRCQSAPPSSRHCFNMGQVCELRKRGLVSAHHAHYVPCTPGTPPGTPIITLRTPPGTPPGAPDTPGTPLRRHMGHTTRHTRHTTRHTTKYISWLESGGGIGEERGGEGRRGDERRGEEMGGFTPLSKVGSSLSDLLRIRRLPATQWTMQSAPSDTWTRHRETGVTPWLPDDHVFVAHRVQRQLLVWSVRRCKSERIALIHKPLGRGRRYCSRNPSAPPAQIAVHGSATLPSFVDGDPHTSSSCPGRSHDRAAKRFGAVPRFTSVVPACHLNHGSQPSPVTVLPKMPAVSHVHQIYGVYRDG